MSAELTDYELIDHGIQNSQYFQGCGVSGTFFDYVVTGIGSYPAKAIDDCIEMIASGTTLDIDFNKFEELIKKDEGWKFFPNFPTVCENCDAEDESVCDGCEQHYFVSIRFNEPEVPIKKEN